MVMVVGVIIFIALNVIVLSVTSRKPHASYGLGRTGIAVIAPFQEAFFRSIRFVGDIWDNYFFLVSVTRENERLKRRLNILLEENNRYREIELVNSRMRALLDFKRTVNRKVLSAEVIGKDPSPWFRSVIIDKGRADGVEIGFPVVVPQGIVGQVTEASFHYAKVLLIIDQNNAADGLVQRTRARGVIKGEFPDRCIFKYVLRKHDIEVGDTIVTSGLDGVFPKGLRIGRVSDVVKRNAGIFQEVSVVPFADFEKIEEVLVIVNAPNHELTDEK